MQGRTSVPVPSSRLRIPMDGRRSTNGPESSAVPPVGRGASGAQGPAGSTRTTSDAPPASVLVGAQTPGKPASVDAAAVEELVLTSMDPDRVPGLAVSVV